MAHQTAVLATPFEACASHITINQVDALDCELRRLDEVEHLGVVGPAEIKPVADGQRPHLPPHRRWDPRAPQGVHPLFADVGVKGRQYFLCARLSLSPPLALAPSPLTLGPTL